LKKYFTYFLHPVLFILVFLIHAGNLSAQEKSKILVHSSDTIVIDSLPMVSTTVKVFADGELLKAGTDFVFVKDYRAILLQKGKHVDTLRILYYTLPEWLLKTRKHRDANITSTGGVPITGVESGNTSIQTEETVVTDGTLLRGLSFGNAQDIVLNSSLNLRMHGKVGKDIEIEGAVTDQEYPFQPEGTTTTLQDFDRIYIALHMPHLNVLLGDYLFQSSASARFMKYSKKNRGLQLYGTDSLGKSAVKWEIAAALARGRFSRNEINGTEGLQGPYRLSGSRGEQFVIVVSGTEVVYLDGQKMERGLQSDYVIDYNAGEITFTPKHIITAYSRIVVEFQYSDRFYTRSVTGANATIQHKNATWFAAIYSEQDSKSQPIQQDLELTDSSTGLTAREILRNAGDDPTLALFPGGRKLQAFNGNEPNYILKDTGGIDFYEYVEAADTHKVFYRVTFSYVGVGKGTYSVTATTANGKVYKYVGYISGVPAGDYEPLTRIQAPNRLTMAEGGLAWKLTKNTTVNSNLAFSNNDRNLFSAIGDADNSGMAANISITDKRKLFKKDTAGKWYIQSKLQAEQTSKYFTSIERYRDVEFGREWNRSLYNPENGLDPKNSGYLIAGVEIGKKDKFSWTNSAGMNKTGNLDARNFKTGIYFRQKSFYIQPSVQISEAEVSGIHNHFEKIYSDLGWKLKKSNLVFSVQDEKSKFTNTLGQELQQNYAFQSAGMQLNKSWKKWNLNIQAQERKNKNIRNFQLEDASVARNGSIEFYGKSGKSTNFKVSGNFRQMVLLDTFFKNLYSTENHIAGRLEYGFAKVLNAMHGNFYYQTISGREQQRQFTYFEVPAGQGFYTWVDFNGNGQKEVNEFQETPFKDQAKYIRLLVPTGTYIKSQGTEFNGNILIQPEFKKMKKKPGKFTNRVTWNYTGKSTDSSWFQRLVPFVQQANTKSLLSFNSYFRELFEYETNDGKWMMQFNLQQRGSKLYFTNGFDFKNTLSKQVFSRLNLQNKMQIRLGFENKSSAYSSEFVPLNNFSYTMKSLEPVITIQPGTRFRLGLNGRWSDYKNDTMHIAQLYEGGIQANKSLGKSGMLEMKLTILDARYLQKKGTTLAYDILQGFSSGKNYRGTIDLRFQISKNIQMSLSYEGRKTADVKLIHVGRAEARYLF